MTRSRLLALRIILTYGTNAMTILDARAARLRQQKRFADADVMHAIVDRADEFLTMDEKTRR